MLCAENVGDILKVIRAYVKLFNRDIANVGVKPRENYEVEIHISVNFKPEWNDASRQFHVNVIASATYKLIMDLLGNDFPISALTVPVHGADKTIYEGFFSLPVKHEGNDIIYSHRLSNPGIIDLVMIEVQSGEYLGEDDIVRFNDIYGRAPASDEKKA